MPNNRFRDAYWALFAACALPLGLVLQGCGDDNGSPGPAPDDTACGCIGSGPPVGFYGTTEGGADAPGEASEATPSEADDAGADTNDAADTAVDAGADAAVDASASASDAADASAD